MKIRNIQDYFKKTPWLFILGWFALSRFILGVIGVVSYTIFKPILGSHYKWHYSDIALLDIWGKWDTSWYLGIAQNGYSSNIDALPNLSFFPLYPFFIKTFSLIVRDYYISALLISNIALILSAYYLYKILGKMFNESVAKTGLIYLFIFPASFILSGAFAESLFLLFSAMTFYYASMRRWWIAGICSTLLVLTKSFGILIILPLFILYLQDINFNIKRLKLNILHLTLPVFGLCAFFAYCYYLTGNPFAYFTAQAAATGNTNMMNPLYAIIVGLFGGDLIHIFNSIFTLSVIGLSIFFYKGLGLANTLFCVLTLTLYLSSGGGYNSMFRYASGIVPVYLALVFFEEKYPKTKPYTMYILISLQGFLMALWSAGITIIV